MYGGIALNEQHFEDDVLDQVRQFVVMNFLFGDESRMPDSTSSLLESGIVDSTGVLEIVDFLEADMGVAVADHETIPDNLDSIDNLSRFVRRKRAATVG